VQIMRNMTYRLADHNIRMTWEGRMVQVQAVPG